MCFHVCPERTSRMVAGLTWWIRASSLTVAPTLALIARTFSLVSLALELASPRQKASWSYLL